MAISPTASPSPAHSDFREVDQVGPHASSMSAKVSNNCCGRVRPNRSHAASMDSVGSDAGSSSTPATIRPSAFNDHSASRSPYGRLCTWKVQPPSSSTGCSVSCTSRECLVAQNDRFVEEDIAHLRRRPDRGKGHRRVRRARNDNGAVDDVMRQPRLRLDGPPAGVDGVAGGEILCAAQDSGSAARAVEPRMSEVLGQKRRRWNG